MHPTSLALLIAAAVLYGAGTMLSRRLRYLQIPEWRPEPPPALSGAAIRMVREDAEAAALDMARGSRLDAPNPHAPGSRAHVLWETSYHARLIYLTERRPARAVDLAASIGRLRAQGSAPPAAQL